MVLTPTGKKILEKANEVFFSSRYDIGFKTRITEHQAECVIRETLRVFAPLLLEEGER